MEDYQKEAVRERFDDEKDVLCVIAQATVAVNKKRLEKKMFWAALGSAGVGGLLGMIDPGMRFVTEAMGVCGVASVVWTVNDLAELHYNVVEARALEYFAKHGVGTLKRQEEKIEGCDVAVTLKDPERPEACAMIPQNIRRSNRCRTLARMVGVFTLSGAVMTGAYVDVVAAMGSAVAKGHSPELPTMVGPNK